MKTGNCIICGRKFELTSPNKKTCSLKCRRERERKLDNIRYSKKKHEAKKNLSIVDIAVEARKRGMTYGQYVAMKNL